jgi:hypothetical protein
MKANWHEIPPSERKAAQREIRRSIKLHEEALAEARTLGLQPAMEKEYNRILARYYALVDLAGRHIDDPHMARKRKGR